MMTGARDTIFAEAAAWHAASETDAMDWDGFTRWLETDPRHRKAYDEVALADMRLQELAPAMERPVAADNDLAADDAWDEPAQRPRHIWRWVGGAVAAALVALLAVPQFVAVRPQLYATEGTSRTIALGDGSEVVLAPYSRLRVTDGATRMALSGGAWFDIEHDPDRPLTIAAGDLTIRDIGTQFDVQETAGQVRVAVAEGRVHVTSPTLTAAVSLLAGEALTYDPDGTGTRVGTARAAEAGTWRDGRLTYDNAPLSLVAADLSRYAGVKLAVDPRLQNRKFSGTLIVRDGEKTLQDLSRLMGIGLAVDDGGYRLVPVGG